MHLLTAIGSTAFVDWLGAMAGICTTLAFLPQVMRCWRSGSVRDLSPVWLLIFTVGVALWFVYGLLLVAWPMVVANLITLMMLAILIVLKWRGRHQ